MNNRIWNKKEVNFMLSNYKDMTNKEISKHLDRTEIAIGLKVRRLGLKKEYKGFQKNNKIWLGRRHTEETKEKISKAEKGRNKGITFEELHGKKRAKEIKKKISNTLKVLWSDEKFKEKNTKHLRGKTYEEIYGKEKAKFLKGLRSKQMTKRNLINWKDEDYIKNFIKSLHKRPTSYEQKICNLCIKYYLPFIYTGDGTFLIGRRNPDFKHKCLPIVIEVFNNYYKIRNFGSVKNYMKQRAKYFANYGYKTIFINEGEMDSENWEEICLNKLRGVKNET